MKNTIISIALMLSALLLGACSKDSSSSLTGSYTYKTSGTVTLMATQLAGLDAQTLAAYKAAGINVDPVVVGLYPEQGQLHIIDTDGSDGEVLITFNDLLGNADVADGKVSGSTLSITGTPVKAAQLTDGKDKIGAGMVQYSGQGRKYDDMLVIDIDYQGAFSVNDIPMTIISSDVHCVAQQN